jgi:hypothetical protein
VQVRLFAHDIAKMTEYYNMNTQIMSRTHGSVGVGAVTDDVGATTRTQGRDQIDSPERLHAINKAPLPELVEVLRDELAAHHHLLKLEHSKQEAIISRNGQLLKAAAGEQAQELHKIDLLESRRDRLAQRLTGREGEIRLADIIESGGLSAPEQKELTRYQMALKAALSELKKLSDINTQMLIDSRDLFKTMISSLTSRSADDGRSGTRPVLVDANC